jgi:hypothetical protein
LESKRAAVGAGMTRPNLKALVTALLLALMAWLWVTGRSQAAAKRVSYRQVEQQAERFHGLPRGILRRLARIESTHRDLAPRRDGPGCAVGRFQLQVPSCDPVAMTHLQGRAVSTWAAAAWLAYSRKWCAARPGKCVCFWSRWNFYKQVELCAKLAGSES